MKTRKQITDSLNDRTAVPAWKIKELTLEVLLDIRELLENKLK